MLAHYLASFDPEAYPFESDHASLSGVAKPPWWKPNPVDVVFLSGIRRLARRLSPHVMLVRKPRRFEKAFNQVSFRLMSWLFLKVFHILMLATLPT